MFSVKKCLSLDAEESNGDNDQERGCHEWDPQCYQGKGREMYLWEVCIKKCRLLGYIVSGTFTIVLLFSTGHPRRNCKLHREKKHYH